MAICYNQYGLTTPILIFCTDVQRARDNIENRGIREDSLYKVTADEEYVEEYVLDTTIAGSLVQI